VDNKENMNIYKSSTSKESNAYKRKVTGMYNDFLSNNGETADDIINQHLIEEE